MLRTLLPDADPAAPLAIGASPANDPYQIPSMMAAAVLAECGLREMNFGANTPVALLSREAREREARLVWLSISVVAADTDELRTSMADLAHSLSEHGAHLLVGGRFAEACAPEAGNVHKVASMAELAEMARRLLPAVH